MLATMERLEIVACAESIAQMVTESEIADEYRHFYNKMRTDAVTKKRIAAFVKAKEQYEEVQRFGRYHPDYSKIMKETRELKRDMDMDRNVAGFRRAETELQGLLDLISVAIGRSVSEHIKVPSSNPFFDTGGSSCGGGCGSGGSCGCSA